MKERFMPPIAALVLLLSCGCDTVPLQDAEVMATAEVTSPAGWEAEPAGEVTPTAEWEADFSAGQESEPAASATVFTAASPEEVFYRGLEELDIPDSALIDGVEPILQMPELPSGCEATALTILLRYYGLPAEKTVIAKDYIPFRIITERDGVLIGDDTMTTFAGDPFSDRGLGCFIPCMTGAADSFIADCGSELDAKNFTGMPFYDLLPIIADGTPVLVLLTQDLSLPEYNISWYTEDGKEIKWFRGHHAVVLYGYDLDLGILYALDPLSEDGYAEYPIYQAAVVYEAKGNSAMIIEAP